MGMGSGGREVGRGRGQEDWAPPPCPSLLSKQRRYREECRPPWSEIRGVKKTAYMERSIKVRIGLCVLAAYMHACMCRVCVYVHMFACLCVYVYILYV